MVQADIIHKPDHAPWIVDICLPKNIAIIPAPKRLIFIRQLIIFAHFPDLIICEAKILVVHFIKDRYRFQIIQSCKNAFFTDAQASCDNRKLKAAVSL